MTERHVVRHQCGWCGAVEVHTCGQDSGKPTIDKITLDACIEACERVMSWYEGQRVLKGIATPIEDRYAIFAAKQCRDLIKELK